MPRFCENCGGVVRDDADYCPNCGYEMDEPNDLEEKQPKTESNFIPKKLLHWMKSDDEYVEENISVESVGAEKEARGTLEDLRQRFNRVQDEEPDEREDYQEDFEEDDLEEDSLMDGYEEDILEEKPKKKGLLSLFAGAFGKNDVYGDDEEDEFEDEEDEFEEEDEEEEEYGVDETISNQEPIKRWKQNDDYYEEDESEDEYLIYDEEKGFLKRILIICLSVIALTALVFLGVKLFSGGAEPEIVAVDEQTEALESSAILFFEEVHDVDPTELADYDQIYFGNYEGDETSLEEDLSVFSYYTQYSDMQVESVESSAITGNIGAVKLILEGTAESKEYFEENQFRLFGDEWKFDFGYFAQKIDGASVVPSESSEPQNPEDATDSEGTADITAEKQAVVQTIRDFDEAWIEYVNTTASGVFNYLNPGSVAYSRLANANVSGLKEELLELELSNVEVDGNKASVEAYEKFKKNRSGEVSIVTYRWLYELEKVDGEWLVDDYSKIDTSSQTQEPTQEEPAQEEPAQDEEKPVASSGLLDGFTLDKSFSGGASGGGDEVQEIRYSATTNRLVLEIAMDGEKTDTVGPYQVKRSSEGILVTLNGVKQVTSNLPDFSGGLLIGMKSPSVSSDSVSIEFNIGTDVGYKVFALGANNDTTARLVIDFAK
ncbi:zinc ribbon domain-containing protein [Clostridia bacterium]|nr:zinc ribbon domain-containing protein [Clostridia bacterium]